MLARVIRQAWWDFYDGLWRLIAVNMVFGTIAILLLFLTHDLADVALATPPTALLLAAIYSTVIWPLFGAAWLSILCGYAHQNSLHGEAHLRHMTAALRDHFLPLLKALLASGALILLLATNSWFYLASGTIPRQYALAAYILAFLTAWLILGVAGATIHAVMLIIARRLPPLRALRLGLTLTVAFPAATLGVIGTCAILWLASTSCQFAGFLLCAFAATATLINALHDAIDDWEQSLDPPDPEAFAERREAYQRRYERGWRDMLRPWEV